MKYQYKPNELLKGITPQEMGLEYTTSKRIELNGKVTIDSKDEELCFILIKGTVSFNYNGNIGKGGVRDCVYLPWKSSIEFQSDEDAVIMQFGALSDMDTDFACISFDEIAANKNRSPVYGDKEIGSLRTVYNYLDEEFNARRLMVGICHGGTGGWTAWPPHEHTEQREEIYVYFDLQGAFAIQCVYEDMNDPLYVGMATEGDMISIPKGYHPNVSCPGGRIAYIYVMAAKVPGDRKFMDLTIQKEFGDKF